MVLFPLCLMELTKPDDREMMVRLYHEYSRYMFSVAFFMLRNPHDAEDVLHDCWISLCKPRDILTIREKWQQPGCELRAFIAKCVRNKCLTFLARKGKRRERFFEDYAQLLDTLEAGAAPSAEKEVGIALELAECRRLILEMPPSLRQMMMMAHLEGMRVAQIARETGKPENAVRSALSKAHARLRKQTAQQGEGE